MRATAGTCPTHTGTGFDECEWCAFRSREGKPRITRRADGWQVECRSCSWLFWSRVLPHVQTEAARHECDPMEVR